MTLDAKPKYPHGHIRCLQCEGLGSVAPEGQGPFKECSACGGKGHRPPLLADVAELKRQWTKDPIWDIETTEGYENHTQNLHRFSQQWQLRTDARMEVDALDAEIATVEATLKTLRERRNRADNVRLALDDAYQIFAQLAGKV